MWSEASLQPSMLQKTLPERVLINEITPALQRETPQAIYISEGNLFQSKF
jgi:hypothetical protein